MEFLQNDFGTTFKGKAGQNCNNAPSMFAGMSMCSSGELRCGAYLFKSTQARLKEAAGPARCHMSTMRCASRLQQASSSWLEALSYVCPLPVFWLFPTSCIAKRSYHLACDPIQASVIS